ncbi:MAG TPA: hypothetical protein VGO47_10445, partial [Chlamydiales bacterium]|nr:hypothetical protein [Chlamydiales bacterium]
RNTGEVMSSQQAKDKTKRARVMSADEIEVCCLCTVPGMPFIASSISIPLLKETLIYIWMKFKNSLLNTMVLLWDCPQSGIL